MITANFWPCLFHDVYTFNATVARHINIHQNNIRLVHACHGSCFHTIIVMSNYMIAFCAVQ